MPYPGYHRMYGSTVTELARRGHEVLVTYDTDKRREATADAVEAAAGVSVVDPVPLREDRWTRVVETARFAADYGRYLDPTFRDADAVRRRSDRYLPRGLHWMKRMPVQGTRRVGAAMAFLRAIERVVPPAREVVAYLRETAPDRVVVTPALARGPSGVRQTETVKAARSLGIPVAVGVASWDHLTSKGIIKIEPDRVFVWNDAQRREAETLHRISPDRIEVTGAQLFDRWFELEPDQPRSDFLDALRLDRDLPYLLYVGSSPNISPPPVEIPFVRAWIKALRGSDDAALARAGVLVRPHPGNASAWADVDLGDLGNVAISPRTRPGIPMNELEEMHYYKSVGFSEAVVGVNTSAMVEASILERPVLTLQTGEFDATQGGTLHFAHLVRDGFVTSASTMDEHLAQLSALLADPEPCRRAARRFVASFIRPRGVGSPATPVLANAVEQLPVAAAQARS